MGDLGTISGDLGTMCRIVRRIDAFRSNLVFPSPVRRGSAAKLSRVNNSISEPDLRQVRASQIIFHTLRTNARTPFVDKLQRIPLPGIQREKLSDGARVLL